MLFLLALVVFFVGAESKDCLAVYGYSSCAYFRRAECWTKGLKDYEVSVNGGSRHDYQAQLKKLKTLHSSIDPGHRTSPLVLRGCENPEYVGGSDDFVAYLKEQGVKAPAGCW